MAKRTGQQAVRGTLVEIKDSFMVVGGCHKVGGGGEVGSLHHNYSLSDMADVVQPLCTMEESFTSINKPSVEICPNCLNGWNMDHTGFFGGSRKCITCGGTGKLSRSVG